MIWTHSFGCASVMLTIERKEGKEQQ